MTRIVARTQRARVVRHSAKLLSVDAMLIRLGDENGPLPRRTWQQWRAAGKAPRCYKLPNGRVVCREDEFEAWFERLSEVAA
jgi:hypothetical protein